MPTRARSIRLASAAAFAVSALAWGGTVQAVNIPEGGAITPGSVHIIHFLVTQGCDGSSTDAIEVTLPDSVRNPLPEAMPGWVASVATDEDDDSTRVRWEAGVLADGQHLEFGLRLGFPDEPDAVLRFPVTQSCGLTDVVFDADEGSNQAPKVVLQPRLGATDVLALSETVEMLVDQVDELETRLGNVDPINLRSRVSVNEEDIEELRSRIDDLEDRVDALEATEEG